MASAKRDGLYKRGRIWWVRLDPLEKLPRSTGYADLEAARAWRAARERMAADPAYAAAQAAKLGEWVGRALAMVARDRSEATLEIYTTKLGHFRRIWGDDCPLGRIDPVLVDSYVQQRRGEGASDDTISREVRHLLFVLRLAKRARSYVGELDTLKPLDLRASYVPRKRTLTRVEVTALLSELSPAMGALVALCVALGCRRGEALRMLPSDIDLEAGRATIRGTKTKDSLRVVPVLSPFRSLVEQALPYLPLALDAKRDNVNRKLEAACRRARIEKASFNDLRRSHATLLIEAGVDRDVVRRLLGHTSTALVDRVYGRPSPSALAGLAESRLLSAAPVHGRDSRTEQSTNQRRPQRESNPRYRRERPGGWYGKRRHSEKPAELCRSWRPEDAGDGWPRLGVSARTLQRHALAYAAREMGVLS